MLTRKKLYMYVQRSIYGVCIRPRTSPHRPVLVDTFSHFRGMRSVIRSFEPHERQLQFSECCPLHVPKIEALAY